MINLTIEPVKHSFFLKKGIESRSLHYYIYLKTGLCGGDFLSEQKTADWIIENAHSF